MSLNKLFEYRKLTTAINNIKTPSTKIFDRYFKPAAYASASSKIQFDILTGNTALLPNLSVYAQATMINKDGRKTITIEAPRYADDFVITDAELEQLRKFGDIGPEMMKDELRRGMMTLRRPHDLTLEFNACRILTVGKILDSDASTELLDYGIDATHKKTLTSTDLWSDTTNSTPLNDITEWKRLIEEDLAVPVTRWEAVAGWKASQHLQDHPDVKDIIKYNDGNSIVRDDIMDYRVKDVNIMEYNSQYTPDSGTAAPFIPATSFILIGICDQWVEAQYAPIIDSDVAGGVGNVAATGGGKKSIVPYYSHAIRSKNPAKWEVFAEQRTLPILKRPDAIVTATVTA